MPMNGIKWTIYKIREIKYLKFVLLTDNKVDSGCNCEESIIDPVFTFYSVLADNFSICFIFPGSFLSSGLVTCWEEPELNLRTTLRYKWSGYEHLTTILPGRRKAGETEDCFIMILP